MITIDISFKYFYSEVEQRRARRRGGDWKGSVKSKNMLEHKFMAFDLTESKETMMKKESAASGKD